MNRLPKIVYEELNPEQQRVYKEIGGMRDGRVNGPFLAWILNPELADKIQNLSVLLRAQTNFSKRHLELLILIVARHWNAEYMWGTHEVFAVRAGLPQDIIDAIRQNKIPKFESADDKIIYDTVKELLETKALSQATYDQVLASIGLDRLIELTTVIGFYVMCSLVLNTFEIPNLPEQPSL